MLSDHKIVAWMQGRMSRSFGPRALGNRSILASPARSLFDRKLERIYQSIVSRSCKFAGLGSGGAGIGIFRRMGPNAQTASPR